MNDPLLVLRPGAIGDALLSFPALAALRGARPYESLIFLAHSAVEELVLSTGLVNSFLSRDGPQADALFAPTPAGVRELLGRVSAAVAWSADPTERLASNLTALGADPLVIAPSRPDQNSGKHVAQYLIDTLAPLGVKGSVDDWTGLPIKQGSLQQRNALASSGPLIVFHLGSGSLSKNWPAERFAELGSELWKGCDARLSIVVGPADDQPYQIFARRAEFSYVTLHDQPFQELAGLLSGCDLYVGNDSSMSHLAGLCGAPCLVLFGPTDPRMWRPLGRRVRVLRGQPLESLRAEVVATAAFELLSEPQAIDGEQLGAR
jgi:heptosyltransferase-3